jgi:lysophospholipase
MPDLQHHTFDHGLHRISLTPPAPIARLAIVHGYGDHAGRYLHFMQWMAQRGVACHAIDLRGHGASTGKKAAIRKWSEYLDDLTAFFALDDLSTTTNPTPLFILGHSHGGLVVTAAAMAELLHVRGVILTSPYFDLHLPVPPLKRLIGVIANRVAPGLAVKSGVGGEMLTRDPVMIEEGRNDPYCSGIATPRWFVTTRTMQAQVRAQAPQFTLPLLMLVAGDDAIANPAASIAFFEQCGSADKTMKMYDDHRHELLRELGREQIFDEIEKWIRERAAQ